jgi:hypothetical protein
MTPLQVATERTQRGDLRHVDYVRLGWQLLGHGGAEEPARIALRSTYPQAYHETGTRALLRLVQAARATLPETHSFSEFCLMFPELLRDDALSLYYSADALRSADASTRFLDPDLRALPPRGD